MSSTSVSGESEALHSGCVTPLEQAKTALRRAVETGTAPLGLPAVLLRERETLKLYFYEPRGQDHQPAHDQDEIYIVMRGSVLFAIGESEETMERVPFGPGDAIFTPAGSVHRFENFTDDFGAWVIMYGRRGGEGLAPAPVA